MSDTPKTRIQLNVLIPNRPADSFELVPDTPVFAGTGASCAIKLSGESVAQFHCMFEFKNDVVIVQDCGTGEPTLVNNQKFEEECICKIGDTISVGQSEIIVSELCKADEESGEENSNEEESIAEEAAQKILIDDRQMKTNLKESLAADLGSVELTPEPMPLEPSMWESAPESSTETEPPMDSPLPEIPGVHFENFEPVSERVDDSWSDIIEPAKRDDIGSDKDENQRSREIATNELLNEELELLRSEVHFLQTEVAEKDQKIAELSTNQNLHNDGNEDDVFETERLVMRLEELLGELRSSDQRVKNLEDLLRLSDEANRAEAEERTQIESWLNEIESRLGQRQAEWDAETDKLKNQLSESEQRRQQAESQIQKLVDLRSGDSDKQAQSNQQIEHAKQKIVQLQRFVDAAKHENAIAQQRIQELEELNANAGDAKELEQKLMQLELDTSRQRAEIARERAELESRLDQVNHETPNTSKLDDSDFRFAAMREHLREIHEEEKIQEAERQKNSLSGRISRLLKRT